MIEHYGCNSLGVLTKTNTEFDMNCPLMGANPNIKNYWQEKCDLRKKDPKQRDCYNGCKAQKTIDRTKKHMEKHGCNSGKTEGTRSKVYLLFDAGKSNAEVSKLVKRAPSTIRTYRIEYNLSR